MTDQIASGAATLAAGFGIANMARSTQKASLLWELNL